MSSSRCLPGGEAYESGDHVAATKLIWLALRNIAADWGRATKEWREAMNQFAIAYGDRFARTTISG